MIKKPEINTAVTKKTGLYLINCNRSRPLNLPLFVGLKPLRGTCNDWILL